MKCTTGQTNSSLNSSLSLSDWKFESFIERVSELWIQSVANAESSANCDTCTFCYLHTGRSLLSDKMNSVPLPFQWPTRLRISPNFCWYNSPFVLLPKWPKLGQLFGSSHLSLTKVHHHQPFSWSFLPRHLFHSPFGTFNVSFLQWKISIHSHSPSRRLSYCHLLFTLVCLPHYHLTEIQLDILLLGILLLDILLSDMLLSGILLSGTVLLGALQSRTFRLDILHLATLHLDTRLLSLHFPCRLCKLSRLTFPFAPSLDVHIRLKKYVSEVLWARCSKRGAVD